jgi:hypothetical protein
VEGMLNCHQVHHLLLKNGNGSIGVNAESANRGASTEIFILWKEAVIHPPVTFNWKHNQIA